MLTCVVQMASCIPSLISFYIIHLSWIGCDYISMKINLSHIVINLYDEDKIKNKILTITTVYRYIITILINWKYNNICIITPEAKKNMCVSDHPTDSPFFHRPTQVFFIVRLKVFFIEDDISKKNEVNRTTLREVIRFWRQNSSKISEKMDNFLIFEEKSHSRDNKKKYCKKKKSRPTDSVL